jgi:predicted acylesterase/phospholipase RssA
MSDRRDFLMALGAAGALPSMAGAAPRLSAQAPAQRALVLSGGGALGAYAAGIIGCLATAAGVKDGQPLSPYQVVCGTSIGALNGWCVATGQYTRLHDLWYNVASAHIMQLKRQFSALRDPDAGAGNQLAAMMRLSSLTQNETAFYDSQPVLEWISRNLDPQLPLVMPLVWVATNLTKQRPEYFFLRRPNAPTQLETEIVHSLQVALGPATVVREASPEFFHKQIFASAAVPLLWDPVEFPGPDGTINEYCDGGVAANSPVSVAHAVAAAADVVLLNPPFDEIPDYRNAIEISSGMWGTMQQKILATDMRNVYFQSVAKRVLARLPASELAAATAEEPNLARYVESLPATDLAYMRPQDKLPVGGADFDDWDGIGKAYRIGWIDATKGFTPYDWKTFEP